MLQIVFLSLFLAIYPSNAISDNSQDSWADADDGGRWCGSRGYMYERRTDSCYKFHRYAKSWRLAVATCHAERAHLTIINSGTESNVLKELYANNPPNTIIGAGENRHVFIGFRKWDDGEWATLFGARLEEAGFAGWDRGEPNNGDGYVVESCGSIHQNGLLNDANCLQSCGFICEINRRY